MGSRYIETVLSVLSLFNGLPPQMSLQLAQELSTSLRLAQAIVAVLDTWWPCTGELPGTAVVELDARRVNRSDVGEA